jgi:hypothetical protein
MFFKRIGRKKGIQRLNDKDLSWNYSLIQEGNLFYLREKS